MAIKFPKDMFHSARLKLTLFYLAALVFFSLTVTLSARAVALTKYEDSDLAQRGAYRHLMLGFSSFGDQVPPSRQLDNSIANIQEAQENNVRERLNIDLIFINLGALLIGGIVSYWFAGRTLEPIEESHESQKRFAADASHELRTPLTNLRLENEIFLRQKDFTSKDARELIASNLEEISRLENLSASLLSLAQFDNPNLELSKLDVRRVIDAAISNTAKAAEAKNIKFEKSVESAKIYGHLNSLTQLLCIVLDNAAKYGPKKSSIFISGKRDGDSYVIRVRDQGQGIDEADLPHIFERLYRGDKARSSNGGYGLGLSLAQEIAAVNNATIEAGNSAEGGAEFTITLEKT